MSGDNGNKSEAPEFQPEEQPEVRRQYTVESLKCRLSRDEKLIIGQTMSDAQRKIKELEAALKSAQKQIQADITAQKAIMDGCADKINSGYEFRNVRCEVRKNRTRKTIETIRLDTYEVTQSRQMSKEEQQELPLEPGSEEERAFDCLPLAADAAVMQEV